MYGLKYNMYNCIHIYIYMYLYNKHCEFTQSLSVCFLKVECWPVFPKLMHRSSAYMQTIILQDLLF